jgi:hypothetical protein
MLMPPKVPRVCANRAISPDRAMSRMSWADLGWPDLSRDWPELTEPRPHVAPPPRPDVPADIAARVARAERIRGIVVPLCALAGCGLVGAAALAARAASHTSALALILAALVVGFVGPALVVLLVIGPSWTQRRQHLALQLWQRELRRWRAAERARYLASLTPEQRERLRRALANSPADVAPGFE